MAYDLAIREEELKNKVARDFFPSFDNTKIIGDIDFCISDKNNHSLSFLWAEAKKGASHSIYHSFIQLILTIGKARTFEKNIPPYFLGAFDAEKIAFLPYHLIADIFNKNDFNWNVTPSDHESKEFIELNDLVISSITKGLVVFEFDNPDLGGFIKANFKSHNTGINKIEITRNNFTTIYYRWLEQVKDTININWDMAKQAGILDADFYLADMLSYDNKTLKNKLFVLLKDDHYEFARSINEIMGTISVTSTSFNDSQKAHARFWNIYKRPPREEFWDFIIERRDLLVPQDVRERKGSFFTPRKWVELSQDYLAKVLGENWQDNYYIWDCAAGTGNLLAGLTNKYKIWASTLDQSDVDVMKERIVNGANLLESHVFKFDFLNDDFSKLPDGLKKIINDPGEREKLLIYINPPYAESSNAKQIGGTGRNKTGVALTNIYQNSQTIIGTAARELYAQFLYRIYNEIHGCKTAHFAKLKALQSSNFKKFRQYFIARLESLCLVPANTFDNVKGQFPIGFFIWDTKINEKFTYISADTYDREGNKGLSKKIYCYDNRKLVIDWLRNYYDNNNTRIASLRFAGTDIQNQMRTFLTSKPSENDIKKCLVTSVTAYNLIVISIYLVIRKAIKATWVNDRDQYLFPKESWKEDYEFQSNCLVYAIFNNEVRSAESPVSWIPFSEAEIEAKDAFSNHFMYSFINGKEKLVKPDSQKKLLEGEAAGFFPKIDFSPEAVAVMSAARGIFRYYHSKENINPDAFFTDIKDYFRKNKDDPIYDSLYANYKDAINTLSRAIGPKIYEHGFLLA